MEYNRSTNEKEKRVFKIVLTGGPCAGKSKALIYIQDFFVDKGYKVIIIPETATELINREIAPWTCSSMKKFQSIVFDLQLQKEKNCMEQASSLDTSKVLIVCDRGAPDCKAYLDESEYQSILDNRGVNETDIRESYDAVFHLQSAAKGAEDFYNLGNAARTETIEEARALDDKTLSVWSGHHYLRVIESSANFEVKITKLLSNICVFLNSARHNKNADKTKKIKMKKECQ